MIFKLWVLYSLESTCPGNSISDEYKIFMISMQNEENYPIIITYYPAYLASGKHVLHCCSVPKDVESEQFLAWVLVSLVKKIR